MTALQFWSRWYECTPLQGWPMFSRFSANCNLWTEFRFIVLTSVRVRMRPESHSCASETAPDTKCREIWRQALKLLVLWYVLSSLTKYLQRTLQNINASSTLCTSTWCVICVSNDFTSSLTPVQSDVSEQRQISLTLHPRLVLLTTRLSCGM